MTLSLIEKLKERLFVEVPSSLFLESRSVGELVESIQQISNLPSLTVTPESGYASEQDCSISNITSNDELEIEISPGSRDGYQLALSIIADNMGLEVEELSRDTVLSNIGLDSLMALSILGNLRENNLSLSPTFFSDHPTINDIFGYFNSKIVEQQVNPPFISSLNSASSILIQGPSSNSENSVFLFPDGSGSPAAYAQLPRLKSCGPIYALQSPFLKDPASYTCGIEELAQIYIHEVQRRKPQGPYILGGWSVGGVIAFEASSQLQKAGEVVEKLILMDSPCPITIPPMPPQLIRMLDSRGIFSTHSSVNSRAHQNTLRHFDATVTSLCRYNPKPMQGNQVPETQIIWAQEGVGKDIGSENTTEFGAVAKWILDNRDVTSSMGWDELIPATKINCIGVPGNHFTMMNPKNIQNLKFPLDKVLS